MRPVTLVRVCENQREKQGRRERTREEQRSILTHVGYEVWMCAAAAALLHPAYASAVAVDDEAVTKVKRNALLEAFLTHTRSITELLALPEARRRNVGSKDLLVSDFSEVPSWEPPSAAGTLTTQYDAICRYVSHLSWARMEGERDWPYIKIATAAVAVAKSWNAALAQADPGLADSMAPYLEHAQHALDSVKGYDGPVEGVVSTTTNSLMVIRSGASGPTGPSSPIALSRQEPQGPTGPPAAF
jgi:hypothetical protein